jgi:hypothetical protein
MKSGRISLRASSVGRSYGKPIPHDVLIYVPSPDAKELSSTDNVTNVDLRSVTIVVRFGKETINAIPRFGPIGKRF